METDIRNLPDQVTVDESIVLVLKAAKDYEAIEKLVSSENEYLARWLPWAIGAPNGETLKHYQETDLRRQNNESVDWNIIFEDKIVGSVGLMSRHELKEILEIGYWLSENFTGKGIVTRSVNKVIDLGFEQTTAPEIEITCDKNNVASAAVAKRCGLRFQHEKPDEIGATNDSGITLCYRITRQQWLDKGLAIS